MNSNDQWRYYNRTGTHFDRPGRITGISISNTGWAILIAFAAMLLCVLLTSCGVSNTNASTDLAQKIATAKSFAILHGTADQDIARFGGQTPPSRAPKRPRKWQPYGDPDRQIREYMAHTNQFQALKTGGTINQ